MDAKFNARYVAGVLVLAGFRAESWPEAVTSGLALARDEVKRTGRPVYVSFAQLETLNGWMQASGFGGVAVRLSNGSHKVPAQLVVKGGAQ